MCRAANWSTARTISIGVATVLSIGLIAEEPFVINDTTFLLRDTVGPYHAVFIAAPADTVWFDQVAGAIEDLYEDKWVMSQRKALDDMGKKSPGVVSTEYFNRRDWVRVVQRKGVTYLYKPSDFINHFRVQQFPRLIIADEVDGPLAHVVVGYPRAVTDSVPGWSYPCVSLMSHALDPKHDTLDIRLRVLDSATQLTLWEFAEASGDTRYELMVPRQNARLFPMIVHYSPAQKENEFTFDAVGPELLKR